ncbi:hypothetical protein OQA88_11057 [Cercophora sp. LCS_1]
MTNHDDDLLPENTSGYKISQPKQSLADYQKMGTFKMDSDAEGKKSATRIRFAEPLHPVENDQDGERGRPRAATLPGRPYGALPRALEGVVGGPEQGILKTPYKRYGSPYPGVYSSVEDSEVEEDGKTVLVSINKMTLRQERLIQRRHTNDGVVTNNGVVADQEDESLQRYKESLGLGGGGKDLSDPNDPRVCIIYALSLISEGRDPVVVDLSSPGSETTLKDKPFKIKEGAKFTMTAKFKVQHEILSGLHYVQVIKRKGVRIPGGKTSEMIGSFPPNTEKNPVYEKKFAEEEAPSGMLARGHYTATSSFVDDDKKTHLQFEWSFDIAKDW